jgi:hypothetical protein
MYGCMKARSRLTSVVFVAAPPEATAITVSWLQTILKTLSPRCLIMDCRGEHAKVPRPFQTNWQPTETTRKSLTSPVLSSCPLPESAFPCTPMVPTRHLQYFSGASYFPVIF